MVSCFVIFDLCISLTELSERSISMDGALIAVTGVVILIAGYILFRVLSKNIDDLQEQVQQLSEANDALRQQQEATKELLTEAENRVSELAQSVNPIGLRFSNYRKRMVCCDNSRKLPKNCSQR